MVLEEYLKYARACLVVRAGLETEDLSSSLITTQTFPKGVRLHGMMLLDRSQAESFLAFFLVERILAQNSPSSPFYTLSYGCTDHQVRSVIRLDFTKTFGPVFGRTSDGIRQYKHLSKSSHVFDENCLKWPKLESTKQKKSSHHELTGCKENIV